MNNHKKQDKQPYLAACLYRGMRHRQRARITHAMADLSFGKFHELFSALFPKELLTPPASGPCSRHRVLSLANTIFLSIQQILLGNITHQAIVNLATTWLKAIGSSVSSFSEEAYIQARRRIPLEVLDQLARHIIHTSLADQPHHPLLPKQRVWVVDGTDFLMPDSPGNQQRYAYPPGVKPGCGFPQMFSVALFSLQSGTLADWQLFDRKAHEARYFHQLWQRFQPGDVVIGDRAFGSYRNMAQLAQRGVFFLGRLHQGRKFAGLTRKHLGPKDFLVTIPRPAKRSTGVSAEEWATVPAMLTLRVTTYDITEPGFRTQQVTLCTTLLDPRAYPAELLAALYYQRWQVELYYDDIKTTMKMARFKSRTPEMIQREYYLMVIAYNLIRWVIARHSVRHHRPLSSYGFSNSRDLLSLHLGHQERLTNMAERNRWHAAFSDHFGSLYYEPRLGRSEPRCVKFRGTGYKYLNRPRAEMIVESHRNRYKAPSSTPPPLPPATPVNALS